MCIIRWANTLDAKKKRHGKTKAKNKWSCATANIGFQQKLHSFEMCVYRVKNNHKSGQWQEHFNQFIAKCKLDKSIKSYKTQWTWSPQLFCQVRYFSEVLHGPLEIVDRYRTQISVHKIAIVIWFSAWPMTLKSWANVQSSNITKEHGIGLKIYGMCFACRGREEVRTHFFSTKISQNQRLEHIRFQRKTFFTERNYFSFDIFFHPKIQWSRNKHFFTQFNSIRTPLLPLIKWSADRGTEHLVAVSEVVMTVAVMETLKKCNWGQGKWRAVQVASIQPQCGWKLWTKWNFLLFPWSHL